VQQPPQTHHTSAPPPVAASAPSAPLDTATATAPQVAATATATATAQVPQEADLAPTRLPSPRRRARVWDVTSPAGAVASVGTAPARTGAWAAWAAADTATLPIVDAEQLTEQLIAAPAPSTTKPVAPRAPAAAEPPAAAVDTAPAIADTYMFDQVPGAVLAAPAPVAVSACSPRDGAGVWELDVRRHVRGGRGGC
jgi:hypothetical protein